MGEYCGLEGVKACIVGMCVCLRWDKCKQALDGNESPGISLINTEHATEQETTVSFLLSTKRHTQLSPYSSLLNLPARTAKRQDSLGYTPASSGRRQDWTDCTPERRESRRGRKESTPEMKENKQDWKENRQDWMDCTPERKENKQGWKESKRERKENKQGWKESRRERKGCSSV